MEQAGQPVHKRLIENGARSQFNRSGDFEGRSIDQYFLRAGEQIEEGEC